jgi:hypothetical protein
MTRLGPTDRAALLVWAASRAGLAWLLVVVAWSTGLALGAPAVGPGQLLQWDAVHYLAVARDGYDQPPDGSRLDAFFPGLPLLLRGLHAVGVPWVWTGPVVSLVAGAVAVTALARLAEADGPPGAGPRAVLLLVLAPSAVFLAAGYTEALFLALALPAWLAARRGAWAAAGLLTAGACSVRVTGLFLLAALAVRYLQQRRGGAGAGPPGRWSWAWLLLGLLPVLGFGAQRWASTGDALAWLHAQQQGWGRTPTWPWDAWARTWHAAFHEPAQPAYALLGFRLELVALVVGVALTGWLVRNRRWPEAVFVGLQVAVLATSSYYLSVPRATLLWWPLWAALAAWTLRSRAGPGGEARLAWLLAAMVPLSVALTVGFATSRWAG